ncbi:MULTISPECIES: ABC transporter ATP-binding protein [unclassified Crossiella]|uniref:ABC transporter ATP-binding protein n=1 Tax=unclassified Crossiella TaxID=2620835 RepID=UPI001FFE91FF|nr:MULTISPECIES: ABC transporter ATP-binding protein [unclassified Crossiella]MCK2243645.1 ABC transporter ATP-binding protein [Crossiella sp. S99.2]MCK2257503.1 ABC transporter ATP-binding protein [Crossiella sp. S99.1]
MREQTGRITIRGVGHTYIDQDRKQRVRALDRIDLDIRPREFLCLAGASGCGKTTLLNIIAGLVKAEEGTVSVDGVVVRGPGRDRGMVFQEYALLPWRTVLDNVALGPKLAGVGKARRRELAREQLDRVGLAGFADSYPHELSGGMRQRAAVARTLAADPLVMLMDEPFAAVDAQTRAGLQEELVRVWRDSGKTVVFVTHSVEEAAFLADRTVVLAPHPGRVHTIVEGRVPRPERRAVAAGPAQAEVAAELLHEIHAARALDGAR